MLFARANALQSLGHRCLQRRKNTFEWLPRTLIAGTKPQRSVCYEESVQSSPA